MLRLIPLLPAVILLLLGGEGLYHASRSREPASLTCDQFSSSRPRSHLVHLTACAVDFASAGYREAGGEVAELLFPVRSAGASADRPVTIVAATTNRAALAIVENGIAGGQLGTEESIALLRKAIATVQAPDTVDGLVRATLLGQWRGRRLMSGLAVPVAHNAAVIDLGARASVVLPLSAASAGVLLLALPFLRFRRRGSDTATDGVSSAGQEQSISEAGVASRVAEVLEAGRAGVARVMLLNLAPDVGLEAIEGAPPLGTKEEVTAILEAVVPGLMRSSDQPQQLATANRSIVVALGPGDVVHTAVVEARGGQGIHHLRAIVSETGWRAFAPRTGRFADVDELRSLLGDE